MSLRAPRARPVKMKAPAPVQITAEQILREAVERIAKVPPPPKEKIQSEEELDDWRFRKRKYFEDILRRNSQVPVTWYRYVAFEISQNEFERARSIFERALRVDPRNPTMWLKYAEMEMKHRFINSARNVWDRAVTLLPRVDQFWFKYAYMEEMLGNVSGAREVFERWMKWRPQPPAWNSYVRFEMRQGRLDLARDVFERWLVVHNTIDTYLRYARFEEKNGDRAAARVVYERATQELSDEEARDEKLLIAFAQFEERAHELQRARQIYRFALDNVAKSRAQQIYARYAAFERQHGDTKAVEEVILSKKRFEYEQEVTANPLDYDVWFDYLRLEEGGGDVARVRELYERAVANRPPITEKRFWKRYIYLWINYAVFEELGAKDVGRAREVFRFCLRELIPHKQFTFAKIWLMAADLEVRQRDLKAARQLLGRAIGMCPKPRLFRGYIELETQLGESDRVRTLYGKFIEFSPESCGVWVRFAQYEHSLGEAERARHIFQLGVSQPVLDMPEMLWKAFIDFETAEREFDRVRALYTELLTRSKHAKIWISRAKFEALHGASENDARNVFVEAERVLPEPRPQAKEERVMLLEAWRDFETQMGTEASLQRVVKLLPRRVKKRRLLKNEQGQEVGWEEFYDFIFPDEEAQSSALKMLERARAWKRKMEAGTTEKGEDAAGDDEDDDEDEDDDDEDGDGRAKSAGAAAAGGDH
jgi:crooked neck